jgi:hypothetical protein
MVSARAAFSRTFLAFHAARIDAASCALRMLDGRVRAARQVRIARRASALARCERVRELAHCAARAVHDAPRERGRRAGKINAQKFINRCCTTRNFA